MKGAASAKAWKGKAILGPKSLSPSLGPRLGTLSGAGALTGL